MLIELSIEMDVFNKTDEVLVQMGSTDTKVGATAGSFPSYTLRDFPKKLILTVKMYESETCRLDIKRSFSHVLTQNKRTSVAVESFLFWRFCLPISSGC
jgi:hypothetical protein